MKLQKKPVMLPADRCVICQKSIDEIGGRRIIAQKLRGVCLSDKYRGGGNPDYPYRSFQISPSPLYVTVKGELSLWNEETTQRAISAYQQGIRPWFCSACGKRLCSECGCPLAHPVGSDVIYDDGCSAHFPMLPCHPGCINPNCKQYKRRSQ